MDMAYVVVFVHNVIETLYILQVSCNVPVTSYPTRPTLNTGCAYTIVSDFSVITTGIKGSFGRALILIIGIVRGGTLLGLGVNVREKKRSGTRVYKVKVRKERRNKRK